MSNPLGQHKPYIMARLILAVLAALISSGFLGQVAEAKVREFIISPACFGLSPALGLQGQAGYGAWTDHMERPELRCAPEDGDLSEFDVISIPVHSSRANGAGLTLVFYSNNPDTTGSDYYFTHINVNWQGWRILEFALADFSVSRSPLGWDQIDLVLISASGWSNTPQPDTDLIFGPITLISLDQASDADKLDATIWGAAPMTAPPEDAAMVVPISCFGLESFHGVGGFQGQVGRWTNHPQRPVLHCIPPEDFSSVNRVTFLIHSAKANSAYLTLQFLSSNPETEGTDSYLRHFVVNWEGWRLLSYSFSDLHIGREPLGWDKIDRISIHASGWQATPLADSDLIISDLYFTNDFASIPNDDEADASILSTLHPTHPRLLATETDFTAIRTLIAEGDPLVRQWYGQLQADARRILSQAPSTYEIPDGLRLLSTSVRVLERIEVLGMMYQLDGGQQYVDRAWQELEAAGRFPDWNPRHFLDTAEMTRAFAIGYDWFYDAWTDEQREFIRNAMMEKGLIPGLQSYRGTAPWSGWNRRKGSNWNFVGNGGMAMGALAIADEVPELAEELIRSSIQSIQNSLGDFAPDGGWEEGLGYWTYSLRYIVGYLGSLETALGTDFGLGETLGLADTGLFPIYLTGPSGEGFNFGDNDKGTQRIPELFWLSRRFDKWEYAWWLQDLVGVSLHLRNLLWYPAAMNREFDVKDLPLDRFFRNVEIVSMRSDWEDEEARFIAFKAGTNPGGHGDLDLGSFVLDAMGVRWASELGKDNYNLDGYFDYTPLGKRWDYYRKRAEGQNTLVINPDSTPGQERPAFGRIIMQSSSPTEAMAVADLTSAYGEASRYHRGVALLDDRRQFLIQDEVVTSEPADVWWFMHTTASIDLSEDGTSAVLRQGNKRLLARILSPTDATFEVLSATPLPGSPQPVGQNSNFGYRRLAVHVKDSTELQLAINFVPLEAGEYVPGAPAVLPLAEWEHETDSPLWGRMTRLIVESEEIVQGKRLQGEASIRFVLDTGENFSPERVNVWVADGPRLYCAPDIPDEIMLDTRMLADGSHELIVELTLANGEKQTLSIPFQVENWWQLTDEHNPPHVSAWFGTQDLSKTIEASDGWSYVSGSPEAGGSNTNRRVRAKNTTEYLVWETPNLREFALKVFSRSKDLNERLILQVSTTEREVWHEVPYVVDVSDGSEPGWYLHEFNGQLGDGISDQAVKFFKITVPVSDIAPDEIQIGQVDFKGLK